MRVCDDADFACMGDVLKRLDAAACRDVSPDFTSRVMARVARFERCRRIAGRSAWAAAASLAIVCGAWLGMRPGGGVSAAAACGVAADYMRVFAVKDSSGGELESALEGIIAAQGEDGAWLHSRLTACTVAALADVSRRGLASGESVRAYKRGLRWMRANGVAELSPADFARECEHAGRWGT